MAKKKTETMAKSEMPTEITKKKVGDVVERIERELKKFDNKDYNLFRLNKSIIFFCISIKSHTSLNLLGTT